MAQPRPFEHSIGLGLEASFGSPVAPTIWLPGTSSLKKPPGIAVLENPVGEWEESRVTRRPTKVEGSLELEIIPGATTILRALLTRKGRRNLNSISVYDNYGDQTAFRNLGITAKSATFKCASGEDLMGSFDCVGRTRDRVTPLIPDFDLTAPYTYEEMIVTAAGAPEYHLSEVEIGYDFAVVDDKFRSDGTGLLREVPTDGQAVVVTLQHDFEHADLWDLAMAGTELSLTLVFTRLAHVLTWTMPRCIHLEGDVEGNEQPLELKPLRSADGTAAVTLTEV